MNTIQKTFNELALNTDILSNLSVNEGETPIPISEPIDTGAQQLLGNYSNTWLTYPPNEVEYLVQTLNEHLENCLEIRQKAQDLEIMAFKETSEQVLQRKISAILMEQLHLFKDNEPKLLGNIVNANIDNNHINGSNSDYWQKLFDKQQQQLELRLADANNKLERLAENGSGNNFVERFDFLKNLFEKDMIEAYCRARAAAVGLKNIYKIDQAVPNITDNGYLDKLVLWARDVTYKLEKKFFNIRETTIAFALNDGSTGAPAAAAPVFDAPRIMTLDAFKNSRTNGRFDFSIDEAFFDRPNFKLNKARLKGLDIHVISKDDKQPHEFWRVTAKLPSLKMEIAPGAPQHHYEPKLFIPMATYFAHCPDLNAVPNHREVNNVSPLGDWTLHIEKRSLSSKSETNSDVIDNIIIRMRIAYEKE